MRCRDGQGGRKAGGLRQRGEDKYEMKRRKTKGPLTLRGIFLKPHIFEIALGGKKTGYGGYEAVIKKYSCLCLKGEVCWNILTKSNSHCIYFAYV